MSQLSQQSPGLRLFAAGMAFAGAISLIVSPLFWNVGDETSAIILGISGAALLAASAYQLFVKWGGIDAA